MNHLSSSASRARSLLRSRLALGLAASALGQPLAHAASDTWLSTATGTQSWETAANWTLNAIPGNTSAGATASTDVVTFNKTGTRTVSLTDVGRTISGITFASGAGAHTIGATNGTPLYLSSGGAIQFTGGSTGQQIGAPLRIVGAGATYTFAHNTSGGSLQINGTVQGATAGATVLTLDGTNTNSLTRINGVISNGSSTSLAIVKNGSGSWGIGNSTNNNTFSGGVTVNAGTLNIRNGNALGTGTLTLAGGAIDNTSGSALANSRANAIAINGDFTFVGTADFNLGAGAVTLNGTRTITTTANTLTLGGVISGSGFGLTKSGAGTLALGGVSTYDGPTTVNAGTLALGAADRISNSSDLVLGGGTFSTGGFNETLDTLSLTASSAIDFGNGTSLLAFADSASVSWTGTLSLLNFDAGTDSLRFGTSASALTLAQLASISHGGLIASLDNSGYVVFSAIPEPSAFALVFGGLALASGMTRRRRR